MDLSVDMLSLGNADSILVWSKEGTNDYVTIIDGGNPSDGQKVIDHYNEYIKPHVSSSCPILVISTHPHKDHIGGLIDIVKHFGQQIVRFYYNDPTDYISNEREEEIRNIAESYYLTNKRAKKIYASLQDSDDLTDVLQSFGINRYSAFSDTILDHNIFEIVGPSKEFYLSQLGYFTNVNNIQTSGSNTASETIVNEVEEGLNPCAILDEKNDTSAENLTSVITKFKDNSNRVYLFTADGGVDAFESAKDSGYDLTNTHICQLPHHGSRRSINTNWVSRFNPDQFWVSAVGDKKHPRKAVISCIKKNLPNCRIYGTHKGGSKHINSDNSKFPARGWSTAEPI